MNSPKCLAERALHTALGPDLTRLAKALIRSFSHSSVRYVLVGFSNTAVGFAVIWVALRCFGLDNVAANAAGYSVAFLWSFALNRKWTFYHRGAVGSALLRYLLATLVAYGMNLLVVVLLERRLSQGSLFVQIDGMLTYTAVAYAGARYFVFPTNRALSG
ncbi:GtrA family protein [Trinickia sp. Y13]|uniref:GtrA family protein n=1 Tax=Trinickia sp. Y13 TaxID=2917807 RepID=UPI00240603F5|nr:GtrA family protein [Trinickia sp. Y13]MDG0025747.1 GtrA family protein [Trinickia sp. Y13]